MWIMWITKKTNIVFVHIAQLTIILHIMVTRNVNFL